MKSPTSNARLCRIVSPLTVCTGDGITSRGTSSPGIGRAPLTTIAGREVSSACAGKATSRPAIAGISMPIGVVAEETSGNARRCGAVLFMVLCPGESVAISV
ncbi:hypothetical protein [Noviherbaspirillum saxi]|uniref:hypothetical protein n=1 Tax=Noviherbaspirillum saxi TaxID=2320863 RepID=UPI001F3B25BC|nr:hypothetical protein [Noviherbaspirillum saxi]